MSFLGEIGEVREGGMRSEGIIDCVEWSIPSFSYLRAVVGDHYDSPYFDAFDRRWFFEIYPNGIQSWRSGWVEVFLCRYLGSQPLQMKATLSIKRAGGEERGRERRTGFSEDDRECVWSRFCERSKLEREGWMEGGSLTLSLRMERVLPAQDSCTQTEEAEGTEKQDASIQTDVEFKEARVQLDGEQSSVKQGVQNVVEGMEKLLVSGNKSDITVQVNGTEFKVHSPILSAMSPVLSAMLEHDMAEKASNKIQVNDCEPHIFEEYLRYLYTGSFQLPSQQTVFGLYSVADKYLADDLKLQCLKHIRSTLCLKTFCDTVKLALTHRENELLQLAMDFASQNLPLIVNTVEWQNFICENPIAANEILVKCLSPRK